MTVLGRSRVAVKITEVDTSLGENVYLSLGGARLNAPMSIITSFSVAQAENIGVAQCLNGGVYVYAFGHDATRSNFSVGITTFLAGCNGPVGEGLKHLSDEYATKRVSSTGEISTLTVGQAIYRGYLIGQDARVVDAELGIVNVTYNFIAIKPQK